MRRALACLFVAAAVDLAAPAAALACNGWSQPSMQSQLMCITCHVPIDQSDSAFAQHVKDYLDDKCAAGWTSTQVKDALVRQFGQEILAAPPKHGFDLLAWVVPGAVLLAGVGIAGLLALRWSRTRRAPPPKPDAVDPAVAARIDADLARFE
ncbi:MAG TPA: cytochrome c-type biogenesis protein CcmH [Gaiellales bacterium]|nr:cytochrome c-type biogenesis protein CcmH [Gaiellales bacterium]